MQGTGLGRERREGGREIDVCIPGKCVVERELLKPRVV